MLWKELQPTLSDKNLNISYIHRRLSGFQVTHQASGRQFFLCFILLCLYIVSCVVLRFMVLEMFVVKKVVAH